MKIMYIFPHPDDESFGPAGAIDKQIKEGNEVILLTLTKGGATKVRHNLGLSVQEMGTVREKEMQKVQKSLGISEMSILDYEDGGLAKVNPLYLEDEMLKWLQHTNPMLSLPILFTEVVDITTILPYTISSEGFISIKRETLKFWKRLAYFTVIDTGKPMFSEGGIPRVTWTKEENIAVTVQLSESNITAMKNALLCYDTYQEMVKTTNVIEKIENKTHFELEDESHKKVLSSITESITI